MQVRAALSLILLSNRRVTTGLLCQLGEKFEGPQHVISQRSRQCSGPSFSDSAQRDGTQDPEWIRASALSHSSVAAQLIENAEFRVVHHGELDQLLTDSIGIAPIEM